MLRIASECRYGTLESTEDAPLSSATVNLGRQHAVYGFSGFGGSNHKERVELGESDGRSIRGLGLLIAPPGAVPAVDDLQDASCYSTGELFGNAPPMLHEQRQWSDRHTLEACEGLRVRAVCVALVRAHGVAHTSNVCVQMSYESEDVQHTLELCAPLRLVSGAVSYRGLRFDAANARRCCARGEPLQWLPAKVAALMEELDADDVFSYNPLSLLSGTLGEGTMPSYEGAGFGSEGGTSVDDGRGKFLGDDIDRTLELLGPTLVMLEREDVTVSDVGPSTTTNYHSATWHSSEHRTSTALSKVDVIGLLFLDAPRDATMTSTDSRVERVDETASSSTTTDHGSGASVTTNTRINETTTTTTQISMYVEQVAAHCASIAKQLKAEGRRFELVVCVRSGADPTYLNWLAVAAAVHGCPIIPFASDQIGVLERFFPPLAATASLVLLDRHHAYIIDANPVLLAKWMQQTPQSVAALWPVWSAALPVTMLTSATVDPSSAQTAPITTLVGGERCIAVFFADERETPVAELLHAACKKLGAQAPHVVVAYVGELKHFKSFTKSIKQFGWHVLAPDVSCSSLKSRLAVHATPGVALLNNYATLLNPNAIHNVEKAPLRYPWFEDLTRLKLAHVRPDDVDEQSHSLLDSGRILMLDPALTQHEIDEHGAVACLFEARSKGKSKYGPSRKMLELISPISPHISLLP